MAFTQKMTIAAAIVAGVDSLQMQVNKQKIITTENSATPVDLLSVMSGWEHMEQFNDNHSRRGNRGGRANRGAQQMDIMQQIENEDPFALLPRVDLPTVPAVGDQSAKQIVDSIPASEENDQKVKTLVEDILDQNPMIDFKVEQQVLEYNVLDDNHQALVELLNYFKTHNSNKFTNTVQIIQQWM